MFHFGTRLNVDADSFANETIDRGNTNDIVVIDDNWTSFQLDAIRFVDDEGDIIMH